MISFPFLKRFVAHSVFPICAAIHCNPSWFGGDDVVGDDVVVDDAVDDKNVGDDAVVDVADKEDFSAYLLGHFLNRVWLCLKQDRIRC